MKTLFTFLSLLVGGLLLWSCSEDTYVDPIQLTTVRGRVLYSVNQRPLGRVSVTLSPTSRVVTTDSSGAFRFDSVVAGSYTIQAAKAGYGTQVATITTTTDASPLITILLTDDKTQNQPPTSPTLVAPALNSTVQSNTVTLKWTATDPNRDSLTYNVLLYRSGSTTPTASYTGLKVDTLVVPNLQYNVPYLWQVIVKDGINTVNGAVWSFTTSSYPDYSYLFARRMNGQFQIFAANATGSPAQLTFSGSNWRPVASPNRQQIAFISNVNTDLHLFVMDANGNNMRQVTTVPIAGLYATDLSFCWSPDGTQLLYPNNGRLIAIRTDRTGQRVVVQASAGRIFAGCDWTPQGNQLVARTTGTSVYDNEISTYSADGSGQKMVYARTNKRVGNPVFSIDGRQLVFTADSAEFVSDEGRQTDSRIYLLDLRTSGLTDLSASQSTGTGTGQSQVVKPGGTNDLEPRFSPTGAQLIFTNVANNAVNNNAVIGSVYVLDLTNSTQSGRSRTLLFTNAEMPYWR